MSPEKMSSDKTEAFENPPEIYCVGGWWWVTGSEWTSTVREECQTLTGKPVEKVESGFPRSAALLGAVTVLLLLSATALTQAPTISRTPEQNAPAISAK